MVEHDADSPTRQNLRTQGPKQQEHSYGLSNNPNKYEVPTACSVQRKATAYSLPRAAKGCTAAHVGSVYDEQEFTTHERQALYHRKYTEDVVPLNRYC